MSHADAGRSVCQNHDNFWFLVNPLSSGFLLALTQMFNLYNVCKFIQAYNVYGQIHPFLPQPIQPPSLVVCYCHPARWPPGSLSVQVATAAVCSGLQPLSKSCTCVFKFLKLQTQKLNKWMLIPLLNHNTFGNFSATCQNIIHGLALFLYITYYYILNFSCDIFKSHFISPSSALRHFLPPTFLMSWSFSPITSKNRKTKR